MRKAPANLIYFFVAISIGGCAGGGCVGCALTPTDRGPTIYAPFPHHVAPSPDSPSFRFAMVHDVIHERYPKQGTAYYKERERLARENMAVLPQDSEAAFAFTDDIAVGLDRTGHTDEAIGLMRDKLKRQEALGLAAKELYSSYANLGEFLIHGNLWAMMAGDASARERVKEGRAFLRKSLDVNPKAHFGREEWQLGAIDSFLEFGQEPSLARKYDLVGNLIDGSIEVPFGNEEPNRYYEQHYETYGRPHVSNWMMRIDYEDPKVPLAWLENPENRAKAREFILEVGGENWEDRKEFVLERGRNKHAVQEQGRRAPFDEPALWLIGEWRQGSGPNPHYALCLGEIMLRVGQRYLAWSCYERASRLADQFWPTPELQQFLRDHCKSRQAAIEKSLPAEEVGKLRPKFEAELAFGEQYQREYQAYTEAKITAGSNLNDPHFFDEFHQSRPPIASKVGPEEWYAGSRRSSGYSDKIGAFFGWGLLTGGLAMLLSGLISRWLMRSRPGKLNVREIPNAGSP